MGYTHYWYRNPTPPSADTWKQFTRFVGRAVRAIDGKTTATAGGYYAEHLVRIGNADGVGAPEITEELVAFNGWAENELDHEPFFMSRDPEGDVLFDDAQDEKRWFVFCKTARKPYDVVMVACLCRAKELGLITGWSSDGNEAELADGRALAATGADI